MAIADAAAKGIFASLKNDAGRLAFLPIGHLYHTHNPQKLFLLLKEASEGKHILFAQSLLLSCLYGLCLGMRIRDLQLWALNTPDTNMLHVRIFALHRPGKGFL